MKKLFFILASLFVAISFAACSDDDKHDNKDASIVGTWQLVRTTGYERIQTQESEKNLIATKVAKISYGYLRRMELELMTAICLPIQFKAKF